MDFRAALDARDGEERKHEMRTTMLRLTRCFGSEGLSLFRGAARRISPILGAVILVVAMVGLNPVTASAQTVTPQNPDNSFQLDGQAKQNAGGTAGADLWTCTYPGPGGTSAPCDFWDLINQAGNTNSSPSGGPGTPLAHAITGLSSHAFASTFVYGGASSDSFAKGSKDYEDVTSWRCSSTPTPGKDTLTNGYAAAYEPDGHLMVAFGADRYSVQGDADIGFWFFQDSVVCDPATGQFSGAHKPGDILVVSKFVGGGTTPQVAVYEWDPADCGSATNNSSPAVGECANANLMTEFIADAACSTGYGDSSGPSSSAAGGACSVTNENDIQVTWPYSGKVSVPGGTDAYGNTTYGVPAQAFFTGGADITALLKGQTPCFSSFLEDTRSSQSVSATLKDFLGGSFPVCGLSATKTCTGATIVGGDSVQYNFTGTVKNTGVGQLTNISVADNPDNCGYGQTCTDPESGLGVTGLTVGSLSTNTLNGGETATFSGSITTNFISSSLQNLVQASGETPEEVTIKGPKPGASWLVGETLPGVCIPTPSGQLDIKKYCGTKVTGGNPLEVQVNFRGSVQNDTNVKVSNITVTDVPAATGAISFTCPSSQPSGCMETGSDACSINADGSANLGPECEVGYRGSYVEGGSTTNPIACRPTTPGVCAFNDTATASGTGSLGLGSVGSNRGGATCYLCQGKNTCAQ